MAVVNVSPESFYAGSAATSRRGVSRVVERAVDEGADIVDVGATSTAPYLGSEVSEDLEMARIRMALGAIAEIGGVTVSVDTLRASVAEAALAAGASIINDTSGLKGDLRMVEVARERGASILAMAHSSRLSGLRPVVQIRHALEETLRIMDRAGVDKGRVVLDPGIGFFRKEGAGMAFSRQELMPWYEWDCQVLAKLGMLEPLGRPLCVGLSRKSFIGKILDLVDPVDRLPGSLAATAIAVTNGASMIRTHDVRETLQAVRVAEAVSRRGQRGGPIS